MAQREQSYKELQRFRVLLSSKWRLPGLMAWKVWELAASTQSTIIAGCIDTVLAVLLYRWNLLNF